MKGSLKELDLYFWGKESFSGSYYMANMKELKKLVLPPHNFAIGGEYMFAGAYNLDEIIYTTEGTENKTYITCIGKGAFKHGHNIPRETIQTMINQAAEYAKTHDPEDGFPYGTIAKEAFFQCYQINEITIPEGITAIGSEAFRMTKNPSNFTTLNLLTNNNLEIGHSAFRGCENLKDVNINDGTKITKLGEAAFSDSRSLTNKSVNKILENYGKYSEETVDVSGQQVKYIPAHLFFGVQGRGDKNPQATLNFTELTIPADFGAIGEGAFGHTESDIQVLNKITVNAAVAPKCGLPVGVIDNLKDYKNVFLNVAPNYVTITFDGKANENANYKTYRAEREFMRLLTKTLNENNETYDVYPQMHANVVLTRTFKEGWNTLALPFGATASDKDVKYARIFANALGTEDFAVYRGLRKNSQDESKSVFTFLKYASMDYPLNEFEPILVKITAGKINADNKYTFENVDLNFDHDNNGKMYSAVEMDKFGCGNLIGNVRWNFDGKYDTTMDRFNGNDYDTFYFDGTFKMFKDDNHNVLKEGDYIIQDGKFIKCVNDKKYAMKGFRGYFKKFESATLGASDAINIAVYDGDGTVTDIVRVDANGEAEANAPHDIYNVMGQKVRSNTLSTEGLKSGIYIINGKKVLVK
ncbi:MAG: leucine-rich repeat domain-containing protein, partial [Prevotella sp.]